VVKPGVRDVDVAEALPAVATADLRDDSQPSGHGAPQPWLAGQPSVAPRVPRKRRKNRRLGIFAILRRLWIPLLILVVIGAGGVTVSRLHGIFGAEKRPAYADTQLNDTKPFDPQNLTYEIFGPPGTVADISYFDIDANPQRVRDAHLPWSLTFPTTTATSVGSVVAQGDTGSIGCRIVVNGAVKVEKIVQEEHAFTFCVLKNS
jgi:hypothetical protein